MLLSLYRTLTIIGLPVFQLHWLLRKRKGKEDAERFNERKGIYNTKRPKGKIIWFHGASVGEAISMLPLIERILQENSDINILVTTGTVTSAKILEERLPERALHQYVPIDRPSYVKYFLNYWKPVAGFWFESDLWPNLLLEVKNNQIPLCLINGRMSESSYNRWLKFPDAIKELLDCFLIGLAQTQTDAERLKELSGGKEFKALGNVKFAAKPLPYDEAELQRLQAQLAGRRLWLASSTHDGEDIIIANAHKVLKQHFPDILTIIVPRHPERGADIVDTLIVEENLKIALRSAGEQINPDTDIYVANTIGELGLFYRLVNIVLIGKSLIKPGGGQNPLEPARLGCAVVMGEYMQNFGELTRDMIAQSATITVTSGDMLAKTVAELINKENKREALSQRALAFASDKDSVIDRVMNELSIVLSKL